MFILSGPGPGAQPLSLRLAAIRRHSYS